MKKVIEGKLYDTSTAERLGCYCKGRDGNDFNWFQEILYRTKSGRYFLYGEGGPLTHYASRNGNNWGFGERIMPIDRETAQVWAEKSLDGDEYQAIFGEITEDEDERAQLNVQLPASLKAALWREAEHKGVTLSALVEEILTNR
jgi:hypothetical protein